MTTFTTDPPDVLIAQRKAVIELVELALRHGFSRHSISCACDDPSFVRKLEIGHGFRIGTLRKAQRCIRTLIDTSTTSLPSFLQDNA